MNKAFGTSSDFTFTELIDQDLGIGASPQFNKVYCETPIVSRWEDLQVATQSMNRGPNTTPPSYVKLKDNGAFTGVYTWAFNELKEEELFFQVQMPHSWKEGSDIYPHVHFTTPTQTATDIAWGLEYIWTNFYDVMAANTSLIGAKVNTPIAYTHSKLNLPTISGTGKKLSSILCCRLFRDASEETNGYFGQVFLLGFDFHILIDSIGSVSAVSKF